MVWGIIFQKWKKNWLFERCGGKQSAVNTIIHKVEEQIKRGTSGKQKNKGINVLQNDQAQVQSYESCFFSIIRTLTLPPS